MVTVVTLETSLGPGLVRTLSSIHSQSVKVNSILIDGSADKVLSKFVSDAFPRTKVIRQDPGGVYEAMNFALSFVPVEGSVLFLNSSDFFLGPNSLNELIGASDIQNEWLSGRTLGYKSDLENFMLLGSARFNPRLFRRGRQLLPHPALLIPASWVLSEGCFDPAFRIAADSDLSFRIFKRYGNPTIKPAIVSAHEMSGLSTIQTRNSMRELRKARFSHFPTSSVFGFLTNRFLSDSVNVAIEDETLRLEDKIVEHYKDCRKSIRYPFCCIEVLELPLGEL